MNLKERIKTLEQKLIDKKKGDDKIDLEVWNNHPDKLEFIGWDEIDTTNRKFNNEHNRENKKN